MSSENSDQSQKSQFALARQALAGKIAMPGMQAGRAQPQTAPEVAVSPPRSPQPQVPPRKTTTIENAPGEPVHQQEPQKSSGSQFAQARAALAQQQAEKQQATSPVASTAVSSPRPSPPPVAARPQNVVAPNVQSDAASSTPRSKPPPVLPSRDNRPAVDGMTSPRNAATAPSTQQSVAEQTPSAANRNQSFIGNKPILAAGHRPTIKAPPPKIIAPPPPPRKDIKAKDSDEEDSDEEWSFDQPSIANTSAEKVQQKGGESPETQLVEAATRAVTYRRKSTIKNGEPPVQVVDTSDFASSGTTPRQLSPLVVSTAQPTPSQATAPRTTAMSFIGGKPILTKSSADDEEDESWDGPQTLPVPGPKPPGPKPAISAPKPILSSPRADTHQELSLSPSSPSNLMNQSSLSSSPSRPPLPPSKPAAPLNKPAPPQKRSSPGTTLEVPSNPGVSSSDDADEADEDAEEEDDEEVDEDFGALQAQKRARNSVRMSMRGLPAVFTETDLMPTPKGRPEQSSAAAQQPSSSQNDKESSDDSSLRERYQRQYDKQGNALDDIVHLGHSVGHNGQLTSDEITDLLCNRFNNDDIYTYIGPIIVAVNPFKRIGGLYNNRVKDLYHNARPYELGPHLFSLAEDAFRTMLETNKPQAVIISGDSGSGKTVAAKLLMEYIASVSISGRQTERIKSAVLSCNPILEAFGNAKTLYNDNSSRFGRFTDLYFNFQGQLVGAHITNIMLEKTRVVQHRDGERSFHIFYALFSDPVIRKELALGNPSEYSYLNQNPSDANMIFTNDKSNLDSLMQSMTLAGFSEQEMLSIFRVVVGVLQLGNIRFVAKHENNVDCCSVENMAPLQAAANTLQVDAVALQNAFLFRTIKIGGREEKKVPQTAAQAEQHRDTVAKAIYERLFNMLVQRVNANLRTAEMSEARATIGVLDIYGFEIYRDQSQKNSFDQLCINYTNEKIQQQVQHAILEEHKTLINEGLSSQVQFKRFESFDCDKCVDLIEGKPIGVLSLLDEESMVPNGKDESYLNKMTQQFLTGPKSAVASQFYSIPRLATMKFDLKHYAATVRYDVVGWVERNKDTFHSDLVLCMQGSQLSTMQVLFPRGERIQDANKIQNTTSNKFKDGIGTLVGKLQGKKQHFVRCILPNRQKVPDVIDREEVLRQVEYLGLVENALVRRAGFHASMPHEEFVERYKITCKQTWPVYRGLAKTGAGLILKSNAIDPSMYSIGEHKVFFKSSAVLFTLDNRVAERRGDMATTIQRSFRDYLKRKRQQEKKKMARALGDDFTILSKESGFMVDGGANRHKVELAITDKGVVLLDAYTGTHQVLTRIRYEDLSKMLSSPYVDGVVLLQSNQGKDLLLEFDNKHIVISDLLDQRNKARGTKGRQADVDCSVLTDFNFGSEIGSKNVVFLLDNDITRTEISLAPNDQNIILVKTREKTDLYDGLKKRRKNSLLKRYLGDYVHINGSALMQQLKKDYGDSTVLFSAVVSKYNKKFKVQDRIIMLTDKALYNIDVNGYMVNRRVELPQIQQVMASPFCDDFLCVKCEDGHDFFFESPKKSELVHLLLDQFRSVLHSNLRVDVTQLMKVQLSAKGGKDKIVEFMEDPKIKKTTLFPTKEGAEVKVRSTEEDDEEGIDLNESAPQDIYGGLKMRRKESLLAWHLGDYLFLNNNDKIKKMLNKRGATTVVFSGLVNKLNNRYVPQSRRLIVTDKHVINADPDKFKINRCIDIAKISAISVSAMKDGVFVVHVPGEYDYVFETPKKTECLTAILKQYALLKPGQELKINVDNRLLYQAKEGQNRTIKFKHDPHVQMPTIVPLKKTAGFCVRINNDVDAQDRLDSKPLEQGEFDYLPANQGMMVDAQNMSFAGSHAIMKQGKFVGLPDNFESIYGGRKARSRISMGRQYFGDYCRLQDDPRMKPILTRFGDKQVLFSGLVDKFNKKHQKQQRLLVITENALYNLDEDDFKIKRRIPLSEIDGVSVSNFSDGIFAIHCPSSYDYLYESDKKTEIIEAIRSMRPKLRVNVGEQFEYQSAPQLATSVQFVLDEALESTMLEPFQGGLMVRVATADPPVVLESAFVYVKDQAKPIEVFSHPILLKLRKRWRYKLVIRFYVGVELDNCVFQEKIDTVHSRQQFTTRVAKLTPKETPYMIELPERQVLYSLLSKTRVKCKMLSQEGQVLLAVRFVYDVK